jgi:hypothetical protein
MLTRITIMLSDDVLKKLRAKQAQEISKSQKSVSLSHIINQSLKEQLK